MATTIPPVSTGTSTGASTVSTALDNTEIASNFTTFLQLLTTQLKNQNPLDPLDTNQFTQQLVQFAGLIARRTIQFCIRNCDRSETANRCDQRPLICSEGFG